MDERQAYPGSDLSDNERLYQHVVKRIERRYEARTQLAAHFIAFVALGIVGLFVIPHGQWWVAVMGVWLAGLLVHAINVGFAELRDRAIERELERAGVYASAKRKRDDEVSTTHERAEAMRLVHLSDDGELVDVAGAEDTAAQPVPRRRRG